MKNCDEEARVRGRVSSKISLIMKINLGFEHKSFLLTDSTSCVFQVLYSPKKKKQVLINPIILKCPHWLWQTNLAGLPIPSTGEFKVRHYSLTPKIGVPVIKRAVEDTRAPKNPNAERPHGFLETGKRDRNDALGNRWCSATCADHTQPAEVCGFTLCALQDFTFLSTSSQTVWSSTLCIFIAFITILFLRDRNILKNSRVFPQTDGRGAPCGAL